MSLPAIPLARTVDSVSAGAHSSMNRQAKLRR
jgi:hypothetical protein